MTKEVKDMLMELIGSYGAECRRVHEIECIAGMSPEQIHEEYVYVFSRLRSKRKLHMISRCYGDTYTRLEECKELNWMEFYSIQFQIAVSRQQHDPVGTETENEEDWEARRVRRPLMWPMNKW